MDAILFWDRFERTLAARDGVSLSGAASEPAVAEAAREMAEIQPAQSAVTQGTNAMSMHRIPVMLTILLLSSWACANDFVGQASIIDGDTASSWDSHPAVGHRRP